MIMMGAMDNLVKGAAGQAVQNMNLMFGLDETEGLIWFQCSRRRWKRRYIYEDIRRRGDIPERFLAAGLRAGIKPGKTNKDMAMILSEEPRLWQGHLREML